MYITEMVTCESNLAADSERSRQQQPAAEGNNHPAESECALVCRRRRRNATYRREGIEARSEIEINNNQIRPRRDKINIDSYQREAERRVKIKQKSWQSARNGAEISLSLGRRRRCSENFMKARYRQ